jgi:2-methylisocitrate lyase-like PEP mutase family enzyme
MLSPKCFLSHEWLTIAGCGHTKRKSVVPRDQAVARVAAAVDARNEADTGDGGPVIIARTDAGRESFDEALLRAQLFHEAGADMTFVEAPRSIEELERYADEVPGLKLANMLEQGDTPILPPSILQELGYSVVAYPLTLLSASVKAQELALQKLMVGDPNKVQPLLMDFPDLCEIVGFDEYYRREDKFKA